MVLIGINSEHFIRQEIVPRIPEWVGNGEVRRGGDGVNPPL